MNEWFMLARTGDKPWLSLSSYTPRNLIIKGQVFFEGNNIPSKNSM